MGPDPKGRKLQTLSHRWWEALAIPNHDGEKSKCGFKCRQPGRGQSTGEELPVKKPVHMLPRTPSCHEQWVLVGHQEGGWRQRQETFHILVLVINLRWRPGDPTNSYVQIKILCLCGPWHLCVLRPLHHSVPEDGASRSPLIPSETPSPREGCEGCPSDHRPASQSLHQDVENKCTS